MRRRNWRVTIVGIVLFVMAIAFYFYMMTIAPRSNDPAAMMRVVGTVSGGVGGLALVMVALGAFGRKA